MGVKEVDLIDSFPLASLLQALPAERKLPGKEARGGSSVHTLSSPSLQELSSRLYVSIGHLGILQKTNQLILKKTMVLLTVAGIRTFEVAPCHLLEDSLGLFRVIATRQGPS